MLREPASIHNEKIRYALTMIPDVNLTLYEVDFRLRPPGEKVRGT